MSIRTHSVTAGRLREIPPISNPPSTERLNVSVILIPDIQLSRTPDPATYTQPKWVRPFVEGVAPGSYSYLFHYNIDENCSSVWSCLGDLADVLYSAINDTQASLLDRPLVLISHGFGGVIAKRMLVSVAERFHDPSVRRLARVHSGTAFLGTPHPSDDTRHRIIPILKACSRVSKKQLAQAEVESKQISHISGRFEQAGIQTPVLSIYETTKSKFKSGFFGKKLQLVDQTLAEVGLVGHEKLIGVDVPHNELFKLPQGSRAQSALITLVSEAAKAIIRPQSSRDDSNNGPSSFENDWESSVADPNTSDERRMQFLSPDHEPFDSGQTSSFEIMSSVSDLIQPPKEVKLPCYLFQSRLRNQHFFGRRKFLSELDKALLPRTKDLQGLHACILRGLGGIGKTQIATEFVFTRHEAFDAVFWVSADTLDGIAKSFGNIAVALGLADASDSADHAVSRGIVLEWLSNPRKKGDVDPGDSANEARWLLIFDNADDTNILRDYWPIDGKGAVLVTSRSSMVGSRENFPQKVFSPEGIKIIDVAPFTVEEAGEFLQKRLRFENTEANVQAARTVGERLAGLPLALVQAAAVLEKENITINSAMHYLEPPGTAHLSFFNADQHALRADPSYPFSLVSVWQLENHHITPQARRLLEVISFFNPDDISELLIQVSDDIPAAVYVRDYPWTLGEFEAARNVLLGASLVSHNLSYGSLSLHRLVQEGTVSQMSLDHMAEMFGLAIALLCHGWPWVADQFTHDDIVPLWKKYDAILPHMSHAVRIYQKHPGLDLAFHARRDFARLLQATSWYYMERGNNEAAEPQLLLAKELCEQEPSKLGDILGDTLFSLCTIGPHVNMDRQDILKYSTQLLELRQTWDDGSEMAQTFLATAHVAMAQSHLLLENHDLVIQHGEASKVLDPAPPQFANIFQATSYDALDQAEMGLRLLEEVIDFRKQQFGKNETGSFKLANVLQTKGNILFKKGEIDQSLEAFQNAYKQYEGSVGRNYWGTALVCVKLGELHSLKKNHVVSSIFFDQAEKVFKSRPCYLSELSRLLFKRSEAFARQVDTNPHALSKADEYKKKADELYSQLEPTGVDTQRELLGEDFDKIVSIFSR